MPGGGLFGASFISKLALNPETREYLNQPDFMAMLDACRANPQVMMTYMQDKRFAKALEVGMGVSLGGDFNDDDGGNEVDGPGLGGTGGVNPGVCRSFGKCQTVTLLPCHTTGILMPSRHLISSLHT